MFKSQQKWTSLSKPHMGTVFNPVTLTKIHLVYEAGLIKLNLAVRMILCRHWIQCEGRFLSFVCGYQHSRFVATSNEENRRFYFTDEQAETNMEHFIAISSIYKRESFKSTN